MIVPVALVQQEYVPIGQHKASTGDFEM